METTVTQRKKGALELQYAGAGSAFIFQQGVLDDADLSLMKGEGLGRSDFGKRKAGERKFILPPK